MSHPAFHTISFIGLGLIGGSLARLIRHQLPQTTLYALDNPDTTDTAIEQGVIQAALTGLDDPRLLASDLVILATHLFQSTTVLEQLVQQAPPGTLSIMDLGSTKHTLCQLAESLPQDFAFIGGHPLAGREVSGFPNSRWDLFLGKRFLLTPCHKTPDPFQQQILAWLTALGTFPVTVEAGEHDKLMSLVSHFPQFYAVALAHLLKENNPQTALHFLGGGIDDQMRLMASPFEMWGDIYQDNKANVNAVLSQFIAILQQMQQDLQQDNLATWFAESQAIYALYQAHKQPSQTQPSSAEIRP